MSVSLAEIVQAYRLAKIDAWYFHSLNPDEFVRFEENLDERISAFARLVNSAVDSISFSSAWLGTWRLQPKEIRPIKKTDEKDEFDDLSLSSEPMENFSPKKTQEISFRLMATPTPEFHLLSSLWLSKVGYLFDEKLPKQSYGNRLRRGGAKDLPTNGHFKYYVPDFKEWRTKALNAVVKCLKKMNRDAVVMTADAKSFFHALSPDFLLDEKYLQKIGVSYTDEQRALTSILVKAIKTWARETPLETGLPVGLPASSVIANAAFLELDLKLSQKNNGILSYGRYVDDILVVLDDARRIRRKSAAWVRLKEITNELLQPEWDDKIVKRVIYNPSYINSLTLSRISFEGDKVKVFSLTKRTGLKFVDILRKQITDVSSEFRLLPQNVGDDISLRAKMQSLLTGSGDIADNFRKIDSLRLRKSDFSGLLIEMEFYSQALQITEWSKSRREFFTLCNQYLMSLPMFFDFADKLPRIISLATMCGNFMQVSEILESLRKLFNKLSRVSNCVIASPGYYRDPELQEEVSKNVRLTKKQLKEVWLKPLLAELRMTIVSSFGALNDQNANKNYQQAYEKRRSTISHRLRSKNLPSLSEIVKHVRLYLSHDLAHTRFVDHLYRPPVRPNSTHSCMGAYDFLSNFGYEIGETNERGFDAKFIASALRLSELIDKGIHDKNWIPFALLFPTRPVKGDDLFWLGTHDCIVANGNDLVYPYRGYKPNLPKYKGEPNQTEPSLKLENTTLVNPRIALVSLRTEEYEALTSFRRSSKYSPLKRLNSIVKIVNSILSEKEDVKYILFHELSIPHKWFLPIAKRCAASGVSVIAGVDYIKDGLGKCSNQVWMSLVMQKPDGFRSLYFHMERKDVLAYDELAHLRKLKITPVAAGNGRHGVIEHGRFAFSTLICSEITDIHNRHRLRGLIDALFILAWNQDHSSFSPIIESAALDLHAYIIQCNNNKYGDSRVRVPGKEPWNRDLVRIRGGEAPYYVTVTLDVDKLRSFQTKFVIPTKADLFKPLPQGYQSAMAEYRKA